MRRTDTRLGDAPTSRWNDPRTCPSCGKPATEVVGGRRYSADCARSMRLFSGLRERELTPTQLLTEVRP